MCGAIVVDAGPDVWQSPCMPRQIMLRVQYRPVGRREWTWKACDEGAGLIQISGQRFASLDDAVRDARSQLRGLQGDDDCGPSIA
jgi:hypothetical protein